jgi:hypothetical protein
MGRTKFNPDDIKRIDIKEFRRLGFLQEANRLFFHPLGLALEVDIDEDTGNESLVGVWDYRDDPEGILFGDAVMDTDDARKKAEHVALLREKHRETREKLVGNIIQPIPGISKS